MMSINGVPSIFFSILLLSQSAYSADSRSYSVSTYLKSQEGESPIAGKKVGFFMEDTFEPEHTWGVFSETDQAGQAVINPEEDSTDVIDSFCLILEDNYCLDSAALSKSGEQKLTAYNFWGAVSNSKYLCTATVSMSSASTGSIAVQCENASSVTRKHD